MTNEGFMEQKGTRMKVNFQAELKTLQGVAMKDTDTRQPLTLKLVAETCLLNLIQGETATPAEHLRRYKLAQQIEASNGDGLEVVAEDAALIKERLAYFFAPLITGQAYEMIENK